MINRSVIAVLLALATTAHADPKADAKVHTDKAAGLHAAGKFAEALDELRAAYQADPQPGLLYAIAQVLVKLDRCDDAVGYYEKFLESKPSDKPAAAAREAITACKAKPKPAVVEPPKPIVDAPRPAEPPKVATAPPVQPPPPVELRPDKPSTHHWFADPIGGVLVGVGAVGGVVGFLRYSSAKKDIDNAPAAENYGDSESIVDRAKSKRTIAMIAGVGGGVLIGAGIVRYVMVAGKNKETRGVSIAPASGGAVISWGGGW